MKNLVLTLLMMPFCMTVFGQDQKVGPELRKKFKIGFNLSPSVDFFQPNTEGVKLDKARMKFGYGMMAEYAFTNNYAVAFGLEHKMAGAVLDFTEADVRYVSQNDGLEYHLTSRIHRNDYVSLPITLKLMTNEIGYFTYFGQFGVDFSVLASSKAKDTREEVKSRSVDSLLNVTESYGDRQETEFKPIYDKSSFANIKLRIGAGFEWRFLGNTSLVVSVSYHNGFIDLMKDPKSSDVDNKEGLFRYNTDDQVSKVPFELNSNLHHVALNVGILF
jgi:hypothetical protein